MGTRGFVGFLIDGSTLRGSYNHFDSYPTGLGAQVQADLRYWRPLGWDGMREAVPQIRWVDAQAEPSKEDQEAFSATADTNVSTGRDWYSLLRDAQGSLRFMLEQKIATDERDFPKDSLFCEWSYVLDLKNEQVIILRGFNKNLDREAPFCKVGKVPDNGYVGSRIFRTFTAEEYLALDMQSLEDAVDAEEENEDI